MTSRVALAAACVLAVAVVAGVLAPRPAVAHELSIAELELRETTRGEFLWQWTATNDRAPSLDSLVVRWPEPCAPDGNRLRCGIEGLSGTLAVDGVGDTYSAVLVRVVWIDGQNRVYTLTGAQPSVPLYGSAEDRRGRGEVAYAYLVLGVEHILGGVDHLLFVVALLLLVGFRKRLLLTVTAFTAAHSLTLALSALGLLTLRSPPVEATIALSIVLVAGEALHRRETFARRWPALVAFLFGLVHGLGFAGALKDIGLPDNHFWIALLTFNLGVELGQLAAIAIAWVLARTLGRLPVAERARTAVLYGIGSVAAYWSIGRAVAIFA